MGLRSRLLLLVSFAAIPALVLVLITNLHQRQEGATKVQKDAVKVAQLAAAKEAGLVDATRQHLSALSRFPQARGNDIAGFDSFFKKLAAVYTNYLDFGLIETNGQLVASSFGRHGQTNLAGRADVINVLRTGQFCIGQYQPATELTGPSLVLGHPIFGDDGKAVRVLYAALDIGVINALLGKVPVPDGALIQIVDGQGRIVAAQPNPELWQGRSLAGSRLWTAMLSKEEGASQMAGVNGEHRLYGFTAIREGTVPGLFVMVGIPSALAFAETDRVLRMNLIILGVVALSIWLIAWVYANRYLLNPVRALMETTRQFAGGNLGARTGIETGPGELNQLARAFDQMAAVLQEERLQTERSQSDLRLSERRIRELNAELEDRVRKRTAQLEHAYQELEAFSYSVSHDLRAPLRPIHGYVELLQQECGPSLNEEANRYLSSIAKSAKRMGTLIDNLLAFSRMGRAELRQTPVEMDGLVRDVVRDLQPELAGKNIAWQIAALPQVEGDREMLKQVWANLISNAIKYSAMRDPLQISIGCRTTASEVEFFVRDNGIGFDMKEAHKLFGVFERLHRGEEFEGTGIGLANVRRIILRHGGRTWADGELNGGATFYFSLPLMPKTA